MANIEMTKIADEFFAKNNYSQAEKIYAKILEETPNDVHALENLSVIYFNQNKISQAEGLLEIALKLGYNLKTLKILAAVKDKLYKFYDAIVMYEQIIELEPNEFLYDILQRLYDKVELYDHELKTAKERVEKYESDESYLKLFHTYMKLGRIQELSDLRDELLEKYPNKAYIYDLSALYKEIIDEDLDSAEKLYEKATKMGMKNAFYDLAVCYRKNYKYEEAEKACRKILKTYPDKTSLYYTYASIFFTEKKMNKGYKYYIQRANVKEYSYLKNPWNGTSDKSKEILVVAEQGLGDCIMFARYFKFLSEKFKTVKILVPDTMVDLFSINFEQVKNSNIEILPLSKIYETKYDTYVLMMNLPYYLKISFQNIPSPNAYLDCKGLKYDYFKNKYFNNDKIKIGLCWRAKGEGIRVALQRTIDINYYLQNLFDIEGVEYYSVQKEDIFNVKDKFPQIIDLSEDLDNFEDTAAAIKNMDLVISIDSAPAHLAGALGIPTFLLLPFCPEWRWFQNDKKTEWYSSVEIFKQKHGQNWSSATEPLIERVKQFVLEKR